MTTIRIPTPLRRFADDAKSIDVQAATVDEALQALVQAHTGLKPHLFDDEGHLRNFVNVYLNEQDIRTLDDGETLVKKDDTLVIVPSIAGGNSAARSEPTPQAEANIVPSIAGGTPVRGEASAGREPKIAGG